MKINTLGFWKNITTWGGYFTAVVGAFYALSIGRLDMVSGPLTFGGLAINGIGSLIGMAQSKREQAAKEAAEQRLIVVEGSLEEAEARLNNPHLKHIIEDAEWEYYAAHEEN